MDLAPGEVVTIPREGLREYGVENNGVIDVRAQEKALRVQAIALGDTVLYLVDRDGNVVRRDVHVALRASVPVGHELAERLAEYPCVRLRRERSSWVIEGSVESDEERLTIAQLVDDYPANQVVLRLGPNGCADAG